MADILRIKRRASGAPGAPASLANAELAYNEVDHTLYYGEGTGGAGGTATVVVPIGGAGIGAGTTPAMNGVGAPGTSTLMSRSDHVHPSDTSRAPLASPVFTGDPQAPTPATADNDTSIATTAFVKAQGYALLASPVFTGDPQAPTVGNSDTDNTIATTAFVKSVRLDQLTAPNFDVSMNSKKIIAVADPVGAQDAATKNYVDITAQGLDAKQSVRCATTANTPLDSLRTIDGYTLIIGDRLLVKNQTNPQENGIYIASGTTWTRATDLDSWAEVPGAFVFVEQGTVNADTGWVCTADIGGTLGTTAMPWTQFSGAGQVIAGTGLTKTGNTIDAIGTAGRISVAADSIDIDSGYVGQTSITTLGTVTTGTWQGTTIAVNKGGSGATTLTGHLIGNGTGAFTASATIPNTDITGLGTMSTQNANAVAITGGTIDGITFDCGTF